MDVFDTAIIWRNVPGSSVWREIDKIVAVLNIIGRTPAYNHMLLSDYGGLDFSYAMRAAEENCIYLYDTLGICYLVNLNHYNMRDFPKITDGVISGWI